MRSISSVLAAVVRAATLALAVAGLSAACATGGSPSDAATAESMADADPGEVLGRFEVGRSPMEIGTYGGSIRVEIPEAPTTFNPAQNLGLDGDRVVLAVLFAPLVERIDSHTPFGSRDLAESYTFSDDGRSVDVTIHADATWSDGWPITSSDVVFSLNELYFNPDVGGVGVGLGERLGGVTVESLGERSIRISTGVKSQDIYEILNFEPMPQHVVEPWLESHDPDKFFTFWSAEGNLSNVVSSGPFTLLSFTPDRSASRAERSYRLAVAEFVRNPSYFLKDAAGQQLPYLDRVTLVAPAAGFETIETLYWDGETDISVLPSAAADGEVLPSAVIHARNMEVAEQTALLIPGAHYLVEDHATWPTTFVAFNMQRAPGPEGGGLPPPVSDWLNDIRFRRAVSHLIPREKIAAEITNGGSVPAVGWIQPWTPYYSPGADELVPRYDPHAAAMLLDQMGLVDRDGDGIRESEDGEKLEVSILTNDSNPVRSALIDLIARESNAVGVGLEPKPVPWNELLDLIYSNEYELLLIGTSGSPGGGPGEWSVSSDMHLWDLYQPEPVRDWEARLHELGALLESAVGDEEIGLILGEGQLLYNANLPIIQVMRPVQYGIMRAPYRNISQPSQSGSWQHVRSFAWVFIAEE